MSVSSTFKPSPLSFGSPRASPFRRPDSPAAPTTSRTTTAPTTTTPSASPTKDATPTPTPTPTQHAFRTPTSSPSKARTTPVHTPARASTPSTEAVFMTPRSYAPAHTGARLDSPTRVGISPARSTLDLRPDDAYPPAMGRDSGDALGRLNAAQARELREAFQLLDRDGDGQVEAEDVATMLKDLGQDSNPSAVSAFFHPGTRQTLSLPQFLTQLSRLLSSMSRPDELISAFGAFDNDDDGQIDVAELRDALIHTAPEAGGTDRSLTAREIDLVMGAFTARKTLNQKKLGQGETFRYHEFVAAVTGAGGKAGEQRAA
ncbi:MAG: hypothetical protein M1826_002950 [Phylliscum demangeonii]|nr:MAG: hypothetical protein M1826_002950 [Phylliscum demangeonii]